MTLFDVLQKEAKELKKERDNAENEKDRKFFDKKLKKLIRLKNDVYGKEVSMDLNAYLVGFDERKEYYDKGYYNWYGEKRKLMSDKEYQKILKEYSDKVGEPLLKIIDQKDIDEREWLLKEYQKDYPNNPEKVAEMMSFHERRMVERRKQMPYWKLMEEDRKEDEKFFQSLTEEQLDEYYQAMCEDDEVDTSKFASVEKIDIKSKV